MRAQTECAGLERGGTAEDVPQAYQHGCLWYLCLSEKSSLGARIRPPKPLNGASEEGYLAVVVQVLFLRFFSGVGFLIRVADSYIEAETRKSISVF